jgi:hypothetical protein
MSAPLGGFEKCHWLRGVGLEQRLWDVSTFAKLRRLYLVS